MNDFAATLPTAFGSHGELLAFWQPASGSGNTAPSAWYEPSLVATGAPNALGDSNRTVTAIAATQMVTLPCTPGRVNSSCQAVVGGCTVVGLGVGGGSPTTRTLRCSCGCGCARLAARRRSRGDGDLRERP